MPIRDTHPGRLGVLFVIAFGCSIARADKVQELETLLLNERCPPKTGKCLVVITNDACASGCTRKGYTWTADPAAPPRPEPHMSQDYLKKLRDAAVEAPGHTLSGELSFGYTLEQLLYHQTQVFLVDKSVRYYDANIKPLKSTADAQSGAYGSNTIDPNRFWMVALGNEARPQAMGQGDFALWLQKVAKVWADKGGHPERVDYYLRLSQAAFRAFLVRHAEGGVRNDKRRYECYGTQDCFWFHSGNDDKAEWAQSVLNKNLNAIRNLLWAHRDLVNWRNELTGSPPAGFPSNQYIRQLRDLGRGGLNQLAYAGMHWRDTSAPPNLRDFLQNHQQDPEHPSIKRYNSYYLFYMLTGKADNGGTEGNVCLYHYYTLQLFRQILELIRTEYPFADDPDFTALYYKLLYNRAAGDTRRCDAPGVPPSKKKVRGHPLAELYYGGIVYRSSDSFPHGHCKQASWFQDPLHPPSGDDHDEAMGIIATRQFFDDVYKGCAF